MKYMLLIYEDEREFEDQSVITEITRQHMALVGELGEVFKGGSGLVMTSAATTVRTARDGAKSIHDGPFAETREQLGGYYLVDVPDLDAALAIAKRVPIRGEGSVEVRPLLVK
ncbi:YciI family protein [Sphingomonas sp.]|uniref:YciI family protein n=1 Tax=Sphingomonas sp. TaxID=28214 RepID=UPI001B201457|nr:YciI family protein [Sphingomonas sp.]MBO9712060.1 YciI family protein [Sphingomonas sp.]